MVHKDLEESDLNIEEFPSFHTSQIEPEHDTSKTVSINNAKRYILQNSMN